MCMIIISFYGFLYNAFLVNIMILNENDMQQYTFVEN